MSNLPPGVTEGMIPGNRPQDLEYDNLIEKISMMIELAVEDSEYFDKRDVPDMLRVLAEECEDE